MAALQIRPVSSTVVRLQFSHPVQGDPFFLDPDNYDFEPEGLAVVGVLIRGLRTLDLLTTPQEIDKPYRLKIKNRDSEGP